MGKGLLIGLIALFVIGVGGFYLYSNSQTQTPPSDEEVMKKDEAAMEKPDEKMEKSGTDEAMKKDEGQMMEKSDSRYVEYSKETLDQAAGKRRVLYFYANWCPTCGPIDAELKANSSKIPQDLKVIRINYNDSDTDQEEKDLAKKYNITYQHTFVLIDSSGKEVKKWNGGGLNEIVQNTK